MGDSNKFLVGLALFLMGCGSSSLTITLSSDTVFENSPDGAVIGTLTVSSSSDETSVTFSLKEDAGGRFAILGQDLIVADGSLLDFETAPVHELILEAERSDGKKGDREVLVEVLDAAEVTTLGDSGNGSLRNLIADEEVASPITFDGSLSGVLTLTEGPITISRPLEILGRGAAVTQISANGDGVFVIEGFEVSIGHLSVKDSTGNAILNQSGEFTLSYCRVEDNTGSYGAGLLNQGSATIRYCTFTNNSATGAGAIENQGSMTLDACLISDNSATSQSGGGLVNTGTMTILNSTISGNTAMGTNRFGGGIAIFGPPDPEDPEVITTIIHSTIVGNSATGHGGGIYQGTNTRLNIRNSIVAQNTATNGGPDIFSHPSSTILSGYNFIGNGEDSRIIDQEDHNQVGTTGSPLDPGLEDLADNGGPTLTHAFTSESSLPVNQIPIASCTDESDEPLVVDQRGLPRPTDETGESEEMCDIGAFERQ